MAFMTVKGNFITAHFTTAIFGDFRAVA